MATLGDIWIRMRDFDPERALGMRPPYPPVVLELDRSGMVLVRVKPRRRTKPLLEAHGDQPAPERSLPASIFHGSGVPVEELGAGLQKLFEASGTRPARLSLVLPDNLAKISLLHLPERPPSRRQLDELVRAKMRRAVPFKLDEASVAYQIVHADQDQVGVLVVVVRNAVIQTYERALESLGARVGLVDICTPNLINLVRDQLDSLSSSGSDVALLNSNRHYFSLVIVRAGKLIFFRCKTFALREGDHRDSNGFLAREVNNSFSYYREKLEGTGIGTVLVRSMDTPFEEIAASLDGIDCGAVLPVDPLSRVQLGEGVTLDSMRAQRLAASLGAAVTRVT